MADRLEKLSGRYALYAYSEGKYIKRARSMKFTGIPVLFVPGHGGSFKQVRSLASVTTHRTMDLQSIFHFDFYTIDFNGELSALFGGTLRDQHEFIVSCISKVLNLYPIPNRPKSVIIIGHSMGGMIARSLFMSSYFNPTTVKLIITLATPHQPVILLDKNLKDFYWSVDTFWQTEKMKNFSRLENLTMISIGGGSKDMLVRPGLTFNKLADLNVLTNAIPDVITSTDHLCILWCNNFVKTLSRALYDAVDFDIKGITQDKSHLRNIFYYHLVHCSNGKYYTPEIHQERMKFTRNSTWKEIKRNNVSLIFHHGLEQETHFVIKKPENSIEFDSIIIEAINIDKRDWIAECNAFEDGNNLSQYGTVGFNKTLNKKYFRMNFGGTETFRTSLPHLVVRLPATALKTGLNIDIYNKESRIFEVDLNFFTLHKHSIVIESTKQGALLYMLRLNNMMTMWKVYHLIVTPLHCRTEKHAAYAVFKTPWNHDSSHVVINSEEQQVLKLILLTIPPAETESVPFVDLILDPSCNYSVGTRDCVRIHEVLGYMGLARLRIKAAYLSSIGVITTRYSLSLLANIAALLMLTLTKQYISFGNRKSCPSFLDALKHGAIPWFTYPIVKLFTMMWEYAKFDTLLLKLDTQLMSEDTADSIIIPLILYFVSFAVVYVIGLCLHISIVVNVWLSRKYTVRYALDKLMLVFDQDMIDAIRKMLPVSLSTTIMTVSWITCGGYGFMAGMLFYYVRICYLYKKCIDTKSLFVNMEDKNSYSTVAIITTAAHDQLMPKKDSVHLHSTLFLLWSLCTLTYLPNSVMWYKNKEHDFLFSEIFSFNWHQWQDTSFIFSIIFSCVFGFLWYCNIPYVFLPFYRILCYPFFVIACAILLTCQINIFRLPALLTPVFVITAVHQYYGMKIFKDNLKIESNAQN
ncbi:hypothetical protein PGB90_010544 [Kerria lacca]